MSTALANDRLRKRFARWDVDGNGRLEMKDLKDEATRIAQGFGKDGNAEEVRPLQEAFEGLYGYLASKSGSQAGVTEEQFLQVTGDLLFNEGEAAFNRALGPVVKALVGLSDTNRDGVLDASEFEAWLTGIGLPRSEAAEVFQKVDKDGNGQLTEEELLYAVREYHFGRLDVELLG